MKTTGWADSVAALAEVIDAAIDLSWRYLSNRDGLSASASLVLNRVGHEGPVPLAVFGVPAPWLAARLADRNQGATTVIGIGRPGQ
jgi:hypothetical protein